METKTSDSYQKEILEEYKKNKGGGLSTYLLNPTPRLIKQACILLLDKRTSADDKNILNCFFQFRDEENRLKELKSFDNDRFKPIVNFLRGRTNSTSEENIELISWLIDFKPRPLHKYLKSNYLISEIGDSKPVVEQESEELDNISLDNLERKKEEERKKLEEAKRKKEKKGRRRIITISISVVFGMTMLIMVIQKWPMNILKNSPNGVECMTWADSLYVPVSCNTGPYSKYHTPVEPMDKNKLENLKKVEVNMATTFFAEDGKPMIWYFKNRDGEMEFFTAPGLHPTTGETLKKITPYIIETYVPVHINRKSSFVEQ